MRPALFAVALVLVMILGSLLTTGVQARDRAMRNGVEVTGAYIDLRSGPGRGYPIFHVAERGEWVALLKRRADWVKVETRRGQRGWIHAEDLLRTRDASGQVPDISGFGRDDFLRRRWEMGFALGDFDGADALHVNLGYRFTRHLTLEARLSQNTGPFADSVMASLGLHHQPFPDWPLSPYVRLAGGHMETRPNTTLVEAEDREDPFYQLGIGTYMYLNQRLFLRLELNNQKILTSRDTNQEVNAWQLGFNVYF